MDVDLVLLRHGSTSVNESGRLLSSADPGLSERGRRQAHAAREALTALGPYSLMSSPARRAQETAALLDAVAVVDDRLRERALADWEGLDEHQLRERRQATGASLVDLTQDWSGCPGVESDEQVAHRALAALAERELQHPLVAVSHAGVVKSIVYAALQIPQHRSFALRITLGGMVMFKERKGFLEIQRLWPNPHAEPPYIA